MLLVGAVLSGGRDVRGSRPWNGYKQRVGDSSGLEDRHVEGNCVGLLGQDVITAE